MLDVLRKYWNPVARSEEITPTPTRHMMLGEQLVLWRTSDSGTVSVMKDLCIHRGAALSGGRVEGENIVCPYHGWRYGADGACTHIPSLPEGSPIPAKARTTTYPVREAYGLIWVAQDDDPAPFPDFLDAYESDPAFRMCYVSHYDWATSAGRVLENAMDFSHFNFVHKGYTELADGPVIKPYEVKRSDRGFTYAYDDGHLVRDYTVEFPFIVHDRKSVTNPEGGKTWSDDGESKAGDCTLLTFIAAPVDEATTRIHVLVSRNHGLNRPDEDFTSGFDVVMNQDKVIVESQRPEQIPMDLKEELHLRMPDAHAVLYRRMLREIDLPEGYMP
ncbi:aromatic ring-hydroxylating oxygenase subunit alpha [Roseisalinus antarcticus]|uniref:Methylxanthine N1-demethylase NdmA n=1 Tax=Roseisalinus antarcticus TaxID=254357 RepID=A0A1Y5TT33_9RHOB|nr:aromatic ring-hydroxylating dioxygenase subunit alpha [Roseisalinus antarcticus]SLN70822.1 Methylxanthine N1-demethylase NdmA [Roseisalinus antarcticus]